MRFADGHGAPSGMQQRLRPKLASDLAVLRYFNVNLGQLIHAAPSFLASQVFVSRRSNERVARLSRRRL